MWNPNARDFSQSCPEGESQTSDFVNPTYGCAVHSAPSDGYFAELQDHDCFEPPLRPIAAGYIPTTAWSRRNIAVFDPRYSQNLPVDYGQNTIISPEVASSPPLSRRTAIDTQRPDSDCANPTSLQYMIEEAVTSREDEEEREAVVEPTMDPKPKRKRGRPKLDRRSSEESPKKAASQRVPHNLVERKYREMLNAEMERLRLNVPTLQQYDGTSFAGPSKPSKAAILAAAVDYINTLEADAERLTEENEGLKRGPIDYNAGQSSGLGRRM